jgi:hypothetical protein
MTVYELRINNRVLCYNPANNSYDKVVSVKWRHLRFLATFPDSDIYHPVPLTEEYLLRFGFKKRANPNHTDSTLYALNRVEILYCQEYGFRFWTESDFVTIPFVHSLQNLYFALRNKEMEEKP